MSQDEPSPLNSPEHWNHVSAGYEKFTRAFLGKFSEAARDELRLDRHHHLLDVACGPGTSSLLFAPFVQQVDALDFAEDMVAILRQNAADQSLGNIDARQGDGQELPFDDQRFDRAVSMFGLMFFPDRIQGIREIVRCLKPGGRALVASWAPVDQSPLMEALFSAGQAADPDMPAPKRDLESWENPELFRQQLEEGGLTRVTIRPQVCTYDFQSGGHLWDEMVEGAVPLVVMRRRLGEEAWAEYSAICRQHLEETLQGKTSLHSTAFLAFADKPE